MEKPKIIAYLKPSCGWSQGVRAVLKKYDLPYEDRDIINDALVGLRRYDTPHLIEPDRATAIQRVIEQAQPGDIVILAGKGHETYQVLKEGTIPFDDRQVARQLLRGFGYRK